MIRQLLLAIMLIAVGSVGLVAMTPQSAAACDEKGKILTIKPWYYGLAKEADCAIKSPATEDEQKKFVGTIVVNIVDGILQLSAYVAVSFFIYGGFLFMTSSGDPSRAGAGRKTLINSAIGFVVALSAVMLVNLVSTYGLGL